MHGNPKNRKRDPKEDFFPTPPWATEALLSVEKFENVIWEPACGDGAISRILVASGYDVFSSDVVHRQYGVEWDFFQRNEFILGEHAIRSIVTNPPYAEAEGFVHQALSLGVSKIAMLMRYTFMEGKGRYERLFRLNPPAKVYVLLRRLKVDGKTSQFPHAWFIWGDSETTLHQAPTLHWLHGSD